MRKIAINMSSFLAVIVSVAMVGCIGDLQDQEDPVEEDISIAEQSVSCSGNSCNGLDPSQTPCATGATTVTTKNIYRNGTSTIIGRVELRWSQACGTNWSRVTRTDGAYGEGMSATVRRSDGLSYTEYLEGFESIWSRMVYAPVACATAYGFIDESWTSGSATTACL